jgi:hypothetical protein
MPWDTRKKKGQIMPTLVAVSNAFASMNSAQTVDLQIVAAVGLVIVFSLAIFITILKDNA